MKLNLKIILAVCVLSFTFMKNANAQDQSSWHAPNVSQSLLLKVVKLPNGRLVSVGERGHVLWSDDQSKTWIQANVPIRSSLTGVFFIDDKTGWAVGHDTVIINTTDGGENWTLQNTAPIIDDPQQNVEKPLFNVAFLDKNRGFAVGAYGNFMATNQGGTEWHEEYLETLDDPDFGLPHLYQIKPLKNGQLIMTGEAGFVALGDSNILNWKRLSLDYQGSFFAVNVLNDDVLLVAGLRGNIFRSIDNGQNWQLIPTNIKNNLYSITLSPNNKIVAIGGADGVVLISHDNGQHFLFYQKDDRKAISDLIFVDDEKLISVGEDGVSDISSFLKP